MISDIVEFVNERCEQDQMVVLCERLMGIGFKCTTQIWYIVDKIWSWRYEL